MLLAGASFGAGAIEPRHDRPYFMPASERARIQLLITTENWAHGGLERVRAFAKTDGYSAALLYALERDESHLATAKKWLMQYGTSGGDLGERALKADEVFFRQGQPWLGDVYYRIDDKALVAYDWVYNALKPDERDVIASGILALARFGMRAMDRWT